MKKKRAMLFFVVVALGLVVSFLVSTGFTKNPNVMLMDYSVSKEGGELKFTIAIPDSIGYVRGFDDVGGGLKPHYLDFYNTFGGINSSWGGKI